MTPRRRFYPSSLTEVDDARAGGEADAEADDEGGAFAVFALGEHEAGGGARKVAVPLQDLVGGLHLLGAGREVELRADAVEDLLAARVDETALHVFEVGDGRGGVCEDAAHGRHGVVR